MQKAKKESQIEIVDSPNALKSIYEYGNYRTYLLDFYNHSKQTNRHFSHRLFARMCGFKSPNYLHLLMKGKSRLSTVSTEKVIKGLKLKRDEAHFFRNLVALNEAKTPIEKLYFSKELLQSKNYKKMFPLTDAQMKYLSEWYLPVIRSVIGMEEVQHNPQWISEHLSPSIKKEVISDSLAELEKLGLIKKENPKRWVQVSEQVSTNAEVFSPFAAEYHKQMLQLAIESIDRFQRQNRHLAGMTVALNEEDFTRAKELVEKFRNEIMELASHSEKANRIFQVGLQIFPLFQNLKEET